MNRILILFSMFFYQLTPVAQIKVELPTDTVKIQSVFLNEEREVWIQKPNGYDTMQKRPLLVVLDADGHFNHVKQYIPYLHNSFNKDIPAMIIVGIRSTRRRSILTPKTGILQYDTVQQSGYAEEFLQFIEKELLPHIEKNYRVNSFRVLLAHSLGGLFAIYAMNSKPELFRGIIAASSSVSYADRIVLNKYVPELLNKKLSDTCFLYFTVADNDLRGYMEANNSLRTLLESKTNPLLMWKYKLMNGFTHWSVAPPTFYEGLIQMFSQSAFKKMVME